MAKRRMLTAYYDDDAGELCGLQMSEQFKSESILLWADVLRDLLYEVDKLYKTSRAEMFE